MGMGNSNDDPNSPEKRQTKSNAEDSTEVKSQTCSNIKDSPEEKRQKVIDEEVKELEDFVDKITDVNVLRDLYKRDLRSNILKRLLQEEDIDDIKTKLESVERDKNILDRIRFCNVYRMQIDRYEIIFAKADTYRQLAAFGSCLDLLIPIYTIERKSENRKAIDTRKPKNCIFRDELTRIEKWRIIILWIFVADVVKLSEPDECDNFEEELNAIRNFLKNNEALVIREYKKVANSSILKPIQVLREFFYSTMKMDFSSDIYQTVILEVKTMAKSVHDGYQVCSKEIEKIENFTGTPQEYIEIRVQMNPSDVDNDIRVAQFMDMMVEIGKCLATATVKFV
ncbi:uncharacterized protein LOC135841484 [Planococcus citri]|uniref:uncharacterized protein LOC135841484 n=1 Tax=Planococcus citri TaxID=170843 RepID=UPI0031F75995